jgi:glycosyltransferase involved in cell wall biosynthesis
MKSGPLVSIITPSFNQAAYLEDALLSVQGQSYPRIEHIVVDGGSSDGTLDILKRQGDGFASWTSEPDRGQADAINKGMLRATGSIIGWLNSDDAYMPGAVQQAVEILQSDDRLGMVYADGLMVDAQLNLLDRHYYRQLSLVDLLSFEVLLQPTVFMRRSVLDEIGLLNTEYQLILDHELWIRIAARYPIKHVKAFWSLERTHLQAKTIALASDFVLEAEKLIGWASESPELQDVVQENRARIRAGLNVFAARRLIDAGEYRAALPRLWRAFWSHPATVARYWYKVAQALGSALGLSALFFGYRNLRRRLMYGRQKVVDVPANKLPAQMAGHE